MPESKIDFSQIEGVEVKLNVMGVKTLAVAGPTRGFTINYQVDNACGMEFEVNDMKKLYDWFKGIEAKSKIGVKIVIDGEEKHYSFEDYLTRLGFDPFKHKVIDEKLPPKITVSRFELMDVDEDK